MGQRDREKMETNPGVPAFMRRWAKDVNASIVSHGGWATTTTVTTTTTV